MSLEECQICCQNINKTSHKEIECPKCHFICCMQCIKDYLIHNAIDFHCMKCNMIWTRAMIFSNFPTSFMNKKWKQHQEEIFFTRESSYIPDEQELSKIWFTSADKKKKISDQIVILKNTAAEINSEIYELERKYSNIIYETYSLENTGKLPNSKKEVIKKKFIQPCPAEDCVGYLSQQWKCPMCEKYTCSNCFEVVGKDKPSEETHTCEEIQLKTAELIRNDSKKCPKCGVYIFKISGCNSMFCTVCHTGFLWDTLQITKKGEVHNPHYYEYMATLQEYHQMAPFPFNPNDCNEGPINPYHLNSAISYQPGKCIASRKFLPTFHQLINEIAEEQQNIRNYNKKIRLARWKYINKAITKEKWKSLIFHYEKMSERNNEVHQIYEMFVTCGNDVLRKYISKEIKFPVDAIKEIENLVQYVNSILMEISMLYCTKVPMLEMISCDIYGGLKTVNKKALK